MCSGRRGAALPPSGTGPFPAPLLQCKKKRHHRVTRLSRVEVVVNRLSIRALTWLTVLAALFSALLLASEDTALPELARTGSQVLQPAR